MELQFTIRPGVSPADRGELEDRVVEALGDRAAVLGGGGFVDGSESDFQIEVEGLTEDEAIERCRDMFAAVSFALPTRVDVEVGERLLTLPTAIADDV
jgi:hypothetical protein